MLRAEYTKAFERDIKRLTRRHANVTELKEVIRLVLEDTEDSKAVLRRRHRAHMLTGNLSGVMECHVGNAADWLAIWIRKDDVAVFMRTGSHDDLFGGR